MEIPRFWRTTHQRMRLEADVCDRGHLIFPPRDVCLTCYKEDEAYRAKEEKIIFSAKEVSMSSK